MFDLVIRFSDPEDIPRIVRTANVPGVKFLADRGALGPLLVKSITNETGVDLVDCKVVEGPGPLRVPPSWTQLRLDAERDILRGISAAVQDADMERLTTLTAALAEVRR